MNNTTIDKSPLDTAVGRDAIVLIPLRNAEVQFKVRCRVSAWRRAYGRIEFNVSPTDGSGHAWIDSKRVSVAYPVEEGGPQ